MKKVIFMLIMLIIGAMFLGNIMNIVPKTLQNINTLKTSEIIKKSSSNMLNLTASEKLANISIENKIGGIPLQKGVYNVSQINEELREKLLNPSEWYVTNTSLSYEYAEKLYNETLKIVENSTEQSKSILQKFLGIFGKNKNETSKLKGIIEEIIEKAENLTKKIRK
ncbi:hypothetical protein [Pyrococcus sp. ST04]|uniref:hypothetical protein n=1 Tax=Pyrococcus sp. ST04 TaxID=1183377 RepID=UPI0002605D63|nr:hypothetical protein [Pyrococcus sp. ST04]AFK23081.1 hypothetical protein Py04_1509 [Pyrococcus sp. ST04]